MAANPPLPSENAGFYGFNAQPDIIPQVFEAVPDGLTEHPESPIVQLGEHCTFTHRYTGYYAVCLAYKMFPGTYINDSESNVFRVLTCDVRHKKADRGELTIVSEWVSGPTLIPPSDEFDCDPTEFNPAIEQLGMFTGIDPQTGLNTGQGLDWQDIAKLRTATEAPQPQARIESSQNPYDPTDPTQLASYNAWNALLDAFTHGQDTAYVSGLRLVWTRYYPAPQFFDRGAYRQYPSCDTTVTNGGDIVPSQFVRSGKQMLLPPTDSFDWIRMADRVQFSRVWFKVTRTWLGAPQGTWNSDIYPGWNSDNQPVWATDPGGY